MAVVNDYPWYYEITNVPSPTNTYATQQAATSWVWELNKAFQYSGDGNPVAPPRSPDWADEMADSFFNRPILDINPDELATLLRTAYDMGVAALSEEEED